MSVVISVSKQSQFELLAPGGDIDSIKAAILAGADAVYCGLERFNARNRASNVSLDDLRALLNIAHDYDCKIFLTLNIILLESEIKAVVRMLNRIVHTDIDGVIIQDLGLAYILKHHFPMLDIHASTQLNTHNEGQIRFLANLGCSRVNLSRELNLPEITHLTEYGKARNVLMEVFIHGSYCIGFSGLCYISSARNGASGNRGRCSQPCRDQYQTTDVGADFPLNMKDNTAFNDFAALAAAGVYSLKVEGRMKQPHYVYKTVSEWRAQIDRYEQHQELKEDTTELYKVFNRDFSAGYLNGSISRDMFIDNPRNHAADHFAILAGATQEAELKQVKRRVYDDNTAIIEQLKQRVDKLDHEVHKASGIKHKIADIRVPALPHHGSKEALQPRLNILLSDIEELQNLSDLDASVYYQLPATLSRELPEILALFQAHPQLVPWFPSVLIGDNFVAAETLLDRLKPDVIVTNNTGVGMAAHDRQISWMAGPELNLTNSYALHCLNEEYGCRGAFISNEISAKQMTRIVRPQNFRLCHSIYHPQALLTSRQCLFQQTVGCRKKQVNKGCLPRCEKSATILNLNGSAYVINKQRGEHNKLYHQHHFMNLAVMVDHPQLFTDLFIDLRTIPTETKTALTAREIAQEFIRFCQPEAREQAMLRLQNQIAPTSHAQYLKGL